MAQDLARKEVFFKELEKLDSLTDDSQNTEDDEFARIVSVSRTVERNQPVVSSPVVKKSKRTCLAPGSSSRSPAGPHSDDTVIVEETPLVTKEDAIKPTMKRANTIGTPAETKTAGPTSKRRRTYPGRAVPKQMQIFKGLVFFFFLNNDTSALRRMRIQKAQEYGAIWAKTWGDNVTHAIVDIDVTFQHLLSYIGLDSLPANVVCVNESYPSECIKFRSILNPAQMRFRVNGASSPSAVEEPSTSAEEVVADSLPLKQPKKRQPHTPTPSQPSNDQSDSVPASAPRVGGFSANTGDEEPGSNNRAVRERDALDDVIEETKATKHLPLDSLEILEDEPAHDASDEDSEASQPNPGKLKEQKMLQDDAATESWQQKFACMQKHDKTLKSDNPNSRTIEVLQQMLDYYTRTADHWRTLAYRKAIGALRRQPKKIMTRTQALATQGIGQRLAEKIEEIVLTNRLRRLEYANYTPEDLIIQEFLGVYGAGISQASRWVAQGYRSLEDLKTNASLSKAQRIGVEHYHDFSQRIPRQEVSKHGEIVRRAVHKVDAEMQVIIGGSYRRGASDSGDVDLIITKPDATGEQIRTMMIDIVVPRLFKKGFLQASLASTSSMDGSKWHGASVLPGSTIWRRIDLLFVPGAESGAAMIYFTGNDIFNRSMRLLASKKGMRLNQRGLYADVLRREQRKKLNPGRLLEGRDERRIFELLGVPWRPPEHRIC